MFKINFLVLMILISCGGGGGDATINNENNGPNPENLDIKNPDVLCNLNAKEYNTVLLKSESINPSELTKINLRDLRNSTSLKHLKLVSSIDSDCTRYESDGVPTDSRYTSKSFIIPRSLSINNNNFSNDDFKYTIKSIQHLHRSKVTVLPQGYRDDDSVSFERPLIIPINDNNITESQFEFFYEIQDLNSDDTLNIIMQDVQINSFQRDIDNYHLDANLTLLDQFIKESNYTTEESEYKMEVFKSKDGSIYIVESYISVYNGLTNLDLIKHLGISILEYKIVDIE